MKIVSFVNIKKMFLLWRRLEMCWGLKFCHLFVLCVCSFMSFFYDIYSAFKGKNDRFTIIAANCSYYSVVCNVVTSILCSFFPSYFQPLHLLFIPCGMMVC